MVLVDTSVFIDFFHGKANHKTKQLKELILSEENIAICGLVYQEVLQGIKSDKDYKNIKSILDEFILIPFPESYYLKSSGLYRKLRKKGVTIRKSIDVMISVLCIENNIPLLQNDIDFVHINKHTKLKLHGSA
jgi:predicted nucleic acid-binding protein